MAIRCLFCMASEPARQLVSGRAAVHLLSVYFFFRLTFSHGHTTVRQFAGSLGSRQLRVKTSESAVSVTHYILKKRKTRASSFRPALNWDLVSRFTISTKIKKRNFFKFVNKAARIRYVDLTRIPFKQKFVSATPAAAIRVTRMPTCLVCVGRSN